MSTERERLIAASMLKHLLNDRVVDQVDPVESWEAELDFRLSTAQFGPIREIAQSLVDAIDKLSGGQGEAAQDRKPLDALRKALDEDDGTRLPIDSGLMVRLANTGVPMDEVRRYFRDAAAKTAFKRGGVTASSEYIADQAEAAVNRTLRRQQSKLGHPSNGEAR